MKKSDLVVKSNRLVEAFQRLSLNEIRVIQLGIVEARETGRGLSADKPLTLDAKRFSEVFDVEWQTAYEAMKSAEKKLFKREFTIIDEEYKKPRRSHWIQDVLYLNDESSIQITFTRTVVEEITRIDGLKDFFTSYTIEQTAKLGSSYSVRLYEIMAKWRNFEGKTTPIFLLDDFRNQLGLGVNEYPRMSDFKRRVLDSSVKEINEKTNLKVSYEQVKKGRKIIGFKFSVIEQTQEQDKKQKGDDRDGDTVDMFTGMTDKQITAFSFLLAEDDTFINKTYPAATGESMPDYTYRIAQALQDHNKQKEWAEDLKRVGFNV